MADFPWAAAGDFLGAGLGLVGGLIGNNQRNSQFQQQQLLAQQQFQFQMDAAREGIRWRVDDAKKAGISPLVALGAPTFNPSVSMGGLPSMENPLAGMGDALGRAGQDISAAVGRTMTDQEKAAAAIASAKLANDTRQTEASVNMMNAQANYYNSRAFSTPAFPSVGTSGQIIAGQGNGTATQMGTYQPESPKKLNANPNNSGVVAGPAGPADEPYVTRSGRVEFQPSQGSPASQGDFINSALNAVRNRLTLPGSFNAGRDPTVFAVIRNEFPGAVGYTDEGFGYYKPVYPEDVVQHDLKEERRRMIVKKGYQP